MLSLAIHTMNIAQPIPLTTQTSTQELWVVRWFHEADAWAVCTTAVEAMWDHFRKSFIFVHQVLIPISLYVSIEIVKLGQIYFIHSDLDLYNEQLDSTIQCRALNITEDLGQIQYLFSDKTGTLTENKMVFRRCSIYGIDYPHEDNGENSRWRHLFIKSLSKLVLLKSNQSSSIKVLY